MLLLDFERKKDMVAWAYDRIRQDLGESMQGPLSLRVARTESYATVLE